MVADTAADMFVDIQNIIKEMLKRYSMLFTTRAKEVNIKISNFDDIKNLKIPIQILNSLRVGS